MGCFLEDHGCIVLLTCDLPLLRSFLLRKSLLHIIENFKEANASLDRCIKFCYRSQDYASKITVGFFSAFFLFLMLGQG